jgi:hypothetical protein
MISDDAVSEIAAFGAPRHPIPTVRKSACALLRRLARTSGKVGYGQFEPFDRLARIDERADPTGRISGCAAIKGGGETAHLVFELAGYEPR